MSDERQPFETDLEQYASLHEESIRDRVDAPRHGGEEVPFPLADVEYLLNLIDEQRRGAEALVGEEREGYRRVGPDFDAWADGEFFGRSLRLPDGTTLKLHVCVLPGPNYEWFVALPSDPEALKRCLLELARHEGIDLRAERRCS